MRSADDYMIAIKSDLDPKYITIAVVIIRDNIEKFPIKKLLDSMGIPSQFVRTDTINKAQRKLTTYSLMMKQMCGKMGLELYRLQLMPLKKTMVVGIDVINEGNHRVIGLCSTYNNYMN